MELHIRKKGEECWCLESHPHTTCTRREPRRATHRLIFIFFRAPMLWLYPNDYAAGGCESVPAHCASSARCATPRRLTVRSTHG